MYSINIAAIYILLSSLSARWRCLNLTHYRPDHRDESADTCSTTMEADFEDPEQKRAWHQRLFKSASGAKLLSSQSLRISSSVPSLGNAKGLVETDGKVGDW